jgi:precorrin-6Y C5,15-methyltransferase (decarboxylating)
LGKDDRVARLHKVHIIGIGDDGLDGLTGAARRIIDEAEVLLGDEQTMAATRNQTAQRVETGVDPEELLRRVADSGQRRVVILANGDPLFYGTARYLCDRLGKDRFDVIPHVSSMQLAFARVKESWDEAYLTNLANQNLDRVVERIRTAIKVGLFTTEDIPPSALAQTLLDRQIDYFTAYVCENLGSPDERVFQGELSDVVGLEFSPLNVMILVRKPNVPDRPAAMVGRRLFGNADELFLQSHPKRGLLTPAEVRAVALAEMDIGPASMVWDVGAGSGSVAIEAAQIARDGTVYAIEMDPEDHQLISANAERFGVANLVPVLGRAPEAWRDLPDPDSIFVGGTGRMVKSIVEHAVARLRPDGRIVVNVGSLDNVAAVHQALREWAGEADVWMMNLARGTLQMEQLRFESLNPTFLLRAARRKNRS